MTVTDLGVLAFCLLFTATATFLNGFYDSKPVWGVEGAEESEFDSVEDCGKRNEPSPSSSPREPGATSLGEFPWMVNLYSTIENSTFCCGTLIKPGVVLTAAQCLLNNFVSTNAEDLFVRAGQWDTSNGSKEVYQERKVKRAVSHNGYIFNKTVRENDIGLLFLEEPFELTDTVSTVCLPAKDKSPNSALNTSACLATGWSATSYRGIPFNRPLRQFDIQIVPTDQCKEKWKLKFERTSTLHQSFFCAGGERGKDLCSGDIGAPLVCPSNGHYVQIGFLSWGIALCGEPVPAIYSDVEYFLPWLTKNLA